MMSDTPRNRRRMGEVLSAAFPDLTEKEVRKLLAQAQAVKRGEKDLSLVQKVNGEGLRIEVAVKG